MLRVSRLIPAALFTGAVLSACNGDNGGPSEGPPTGVAVSALTATSARLTWSAASGVNSFIIERAQGTGTFAEIATPGGSTTSFDDTGLLPSTTYRYRIAAVRNSGTSEFSGEVSVTTSEAQQVNVTTDITTNTTWTAGNIYRLVGFRKVTNGATLTIEPGTRIVGDFNTVGSSLFVLRGGRIVANGTANAPVVFSSSQPVGSRQPGDWGGLIIVGNGIINRSGTVNIEGTGTSADNPLVAYSGGTNNADNSGSLRYVRVEYAGFGPAQDAELNTFTFAAVGSGTTLEYLQSLNGLDDSFEWWGGAVDGKYLVSYESGDDHFDMAEGYVGRLQYLIAFQSRFLIPRPGAGNASADPQGIENDGCNGSGCDLGHNSVPFTVPVVANFTVVGTGPGVMPAGGAFGAVLRRGTGGHYINGIYARWVTGIGYRDAGTKSREDAGLLTMKNTLIAETATALQAGQQSFDLAANAVIADAQATAASLFLKLPATSATSPSTAADFDWSLSANSPARTGGLTAFTGDLLTRAGTFVTPTSYRGAADPNGPKWWEGWTSYSRN